ncbi:hypothetical protein [Ralstonia syzygii]|uniref:hypothetical protein n=1 Tax=Ralstonia syzygii TaxID=28097 RepID=UPI0018D0FE64|nr:hypothetical protein [Ralstonia syzygii]
MPEKKTGSSQYQWVVAGATFPLVAAWIQASFFREINRGLIFFLLTTPFFIGLSIANAIQEKNKDQISKLLDQRCPSDAAIIMKLLAAHGGNSASEIASRYWRIHTIQMYLAGHGFGWLTLIFVYFFRWAK